MSKYKVAIISIGNEILLGKTLNTNLAQIATWLAEIGLPLSYDIVIKDEKDAIMDAISQAWNTCDIVISTGGLGPTADDISKATIAQFFGKKLVFQEDLWQIVQTMFSKRGLKTPEINRNQALVPEDFRVLENKRGTAPGLYFSDDGKSFFALPGVPLEMEYIFQNSIRQILQKTYKCEPVFQRTIHTSNISESALAERLAGFVCPPEINMAWLPQTGRVDIRFYGSSSSLIESSVNEVRSIIEDKIWAFDDDNPYTELHKTLLASGMTISVAESCTGGLIQSHITELPGASKYLLGGVIAYSNAMKQELLKVSKNTLDIHGAVSAETAMEMASGIKKLTNSDISISVTGIAGPDGGTDEKPIGTVFFALSHDAGIRSYKQIFTGTRSTIRHKAAEFIVLQLIKNLKG